jgi:hypothetical protein
VAGCPETAGSIPSVPAAAVAAVDWRVDVGHRRFPDWDERLELLNLHLFAG